MRRFGSSILLLSLLMISTAGFAQPTIKAVKVDTPPKLDGDLSDACWKQAPSVTDFYFVSDGSKNSEPTTTWLCYDSENIYMAFKCVDSQPDKIMAQQKKRGGDLGADDWVGFDLDCFNKYTQVNWFDVSAGGIQVERLQTGDVAKIEWKGDWESCAKRTPDGYVVELAVPWEILQYDANKTSMGIAFIRRHARSTQWWWAPNVGPNTDARNFYLWEGLELPKPKNRPMVMAYSMLGSDSDTSFLRAGVDVRHAVTPSLAATMTVNPDFRNVEQSVDSVDFSYNERYLADSRPFFQEGSAHFPDSSLFYSRRIRDIDLGAKVSGRTGDFGIGALHTQRLGEEEHSVMQISRQWADHTWLYMCGTQSHTPKDDSTTAYICLDQVVAGKGDGEVKAAVSCTTAGSADDQGLRYAARIRNREVPKKLYWHLYHGVVEPDYDPYLGLVGDVGIRSTTLELATYDEFSKGRLTEWWVEMDFWKTDRIDGSEFINGLGASAGFEFRNGTGMWIGAEDSTRMPFDDDNVRFGIYWGGRDLYRNGNAEVEFGNLTNGNHLAWSVSQGWQINDRLSLRCSYEYARISAPSPHAFNSKQLVAGLVYDLDNERTVSGRLVGEDGDVNVYLAYRQRVRKGTDAYVIFGDPNADNTRSSFALKLMRVF